MDNPFLTIDKRLENIENLLLDLKHLPPPDIPAHRKIMSLAEFCEYAGLTKQTVYKLTSAQKVPHSKRGKRLYFDREKVDKWLLENQVSTSSEIQNNAKEYLSKHPIRRRG
jgi:excisionase family DNA binding protein